MVWVLFTKVHARFVLSKHVRQTFFFTLIKLCKVEYVTEIRAITVSIIFIVTNPYCVTGFDIIQAYIIQQP